MARNWTLAVTVGGASVTPMGSVTVRAEENQARTATVTFLPGAGSYDPEDWIGAAVTIDHVADPDGTPASTRIFTGSINWPDLDETTGALTLNCADLLQEYFEELTTDAAILAVITGAKLADAVFGEREDGWQRTQDALQTVRAEVHKDRNGNITLTDWAAKAVADYAYTSSGYLYESPRVVFAQRRELVNSISLTFDYRFNRQKIREHTFAWASGPNGLSTPWAGGWCTWYSSGGDLPPTEKIEEAARGSGWPIHGAITYTHLPKAGSYNCPGGNVGWGGIKEDDGDSEDGAAQEEARKRIAYTATWSGRKRYAQTVTENYELTVASSGSDALFGTIVGEDGATLQKESDDAGWETAASTEIPDGYEEDAIGDYVSDQVDRDELDNALECLLQLADHRIAGSHRRNFVEWQAPCEPEIDLEHTAQITAGRVTAKGKVYQVAHELNPDAGRAVTTIRIACSRGGGGASDALDAPEPPDTGPDHEAPSSTTNLTNYLGGTDAVDDWIDGDHSAESYVSGNLKVQTTVDPNKIYPQRVHVVGPDIESEARASTAATATGSYDVAVPNDTFSVTFS